MNKVCVSTPDDIPMWKFRNPDSKDYMHDYGLILDFKNYTELKAFKHFFNFSLDSIDDAFMLNIVGLRKKRVYGDSYYYLNLDMIDKASMDYDESHGWFTIDLSYMTEEECKLFMSRDSSK